MRKQQQSSWRLWTAIFALPLLLLACSVDEDSARTITFQIDGSVSQAAISWNDGNGNHYDDHAPLPWVEEFKVSEGKSVAVVAVTGNLDARMWLRVLENGEEVRLVPGCRCNGNSISVETAGQVGNWE